MATKTFPDRFTLLHNPRCSKSRQAKALLAERGVEFRERLYLQDPLSSEELRELARRVGRPAREWVRRGEQEYKGSGLDADADDAAVLAAMAKHPVLIERPILVAADRAVVGRPPESILPLLG